MGDLLVFVTLFGCYSVIRVRLLCEFPERGFMTVELL